MNEVVLVRMGFEHITEKIFEITKFCDVVLFCRSSPKQKKEIVDYMKKMHPESITLAVGDGANDVEMMNSAHIAVGIRGQNGL